MRSGALHNARVLPMVRAEDRADAVVWHEGRVVHVGGAAEAKRVAAAHGIESADAEGRVVVPGFVDAHTHLLHQGLRNQRPQLDQCTSLDGLLTLMGAWLEENPGPGPVIGEGFDESGWEGARRYPTREELDAIAPERPVAVRRVCGHVAVVNSPGLEAVRTRWDDPREVDPATGLLLESPSLYLNEALPASAQEMDAALVDACHLAHRLGVTAVGDYAQAPNRAALQRAAALGTLRLRVHCSIYVQQLDDELERGFRTGRRATGPDDPEAASGSWMPAVGMEGQTPHVAPVPGPEGGSSPWLVDGGLKVFLDGSIGGHTAYLRAPYRDRDTRGMRNWTDARLDGFFQKAHAHAVQVHAHAIGDGAIEQALAAFARLPQEGVPDARHRIEHYELADDKLARRTLELKIVASCQPNFVGEWSQAGGMYEDRLGPRFQINNRYRTWTRMGLRVCFGSDGMPFGPLYGIACATQRTDAKERLSPLEAIWRYTHQAAWSLHAEDLGHLRHKARADLVILDTQKLESDPQRWGVHETIVDGTPMLGSPIFS